MEKFSLSGLWLHVGSTVTAFVLDVLYVAANYLNVVSLPNWVHVLVGLVSAGLYFYNGKKYPKPT